MPTYSEINISNGPAGVRETLKLMGRIVKRYKTAPAVRELALSVLRHIPGKSWKSEARALLLWVQENIRYVKDIRGVETLQSPVQTLRLGQGDCDDQSILLACLLEAVGHPTRFMAVGKFEGVFCHVYVETKIGGKWVALEPTENWPLGRAPQGVACWMKHTN